MGVSSHGGELVTTNAPGPGVHLYLSILCSGCVHTMFICSSYRFSVYIQLPYDFECSIRVYTHFQCFLHVMPMLMCVYTHSTIEHSPARPQNPLEEGVGADISVMQSRVS